MSYSNEHYHSNHRKYDSNHQNSFEGYHYGSEFSSNYGTNSYNTNRRQPDLNRSLSNRYSHSNHYDSNYATTNSYNTDRGQPDLNRFLSNRSSNSNNYHSNYSTYSYYDTNHRRSDVNMLNNWSSNSNSYGSNYDTGSYINNHGKPDLNMFLNNRSLMGQYSHRYGSNWGTDPYITNHGKSDVTMVNNRSSNSHKYSSKRGSNSYHITNNGKSDFKYKSNSSSSSEIVNAKNNIEEDSDDSHEDNLGEDDSFAKAELPKALIDRFPQHVKILNQLINKKAKLSSPISYSEIQKMGEVNSYCNEEKENDAFLNSLPSHCHTLYLRKPIKNKSSKLIKYPLPLIKSCATNAISMLLSKRDEDLYIKETWKVFRFFVLTDYTKKQSERVWKKYHALFRIVHCGLELNGEYYCLVLREILKIIKKEKCESLPKDIYKKVSRMYNKIADPPHDELGSLLVLAWRYLKDKNFVCFGTASEIKKAADLMQYKVILHNLEFRLGKPGVLEVMSFVDNERCEESPGSSGQDKFVKNLEILNNENSTKNLRHDKLVKDSEVSSNEHSNKNTREDKSVRNSAMSDGVESSNDSKFPRGKQIFTENLQNLSQKGRNMVNFSVENVQNPPKNHRNLEYISASSSKYLKIDKLKIRNLYSVIRIKQHHDKIDLKYKNTQLFPLPLCKNKTTALKELSNIFRTTSEDQVFKELRQSLNFYLYCNKKSEFSQIWKHYHKLSKLIYIDLGLGNGPLYVERLKKIIGVLEQRQFESIPQEIYDEMTEAYKAFADSSYEEIETLLLLAAEYLAENNVNTTKSLKNQVIPNVNFSKLREDIQNYPRNLQTLPKNRKKVVYLSVNASEYREVNKSKLCSYPNVIQIKQRHKECDLKRKNTYLFPLPLSNIRVTALNELAKIFDKSRDEKIVIDELRNMLIYFASPKLKGNLNPIWKNYHRLSKNIYIDLGLGKGPAYVDRLLEILEILEKEEFEIIPEEIYDDLIKAYKVFSDSCSEEIESLLLLAFEYLEDNNVFI